jgi:signal transduction histidine kinase/ActR/RegA family two-component response regulator
MAQRTLRIRHYIGTIVAVCALGGVLLAFEITYLFVAVENRSQGQRRASETLARVQELQRGVSAWFVALEGALGDPARMQAAEEQNSKLLVDLAAVAEVPQLSASEQELEGVASGLREALKGAKLLRSQAGTDLFQREQPGVLAGLEELRATEIQARFDALSTGLRGRLEGGADALEASRRDLWRSVGASVLVYGALVLASWLWVAARLLRPLKALTRESRRVLNGEPSFQLRPDGPHEVRLLTESLSTLVTSLVGARANLEDKVVERTRELERANLAKNEFLANMSHEIRTPMTAILGYAELCLAPDIPESDRKRYAEIIHANGEHLLSVINDILDVSKIEAGRMTVEPTLCSPFAVVSEVRSLMEVRAREKGLALTVANRGAIPEVVRTDPTRLRQILLNLLNNAIKFTDKGHVELRFGVEAGADGSERLAFEVEDTGVGLTDEQITRVFRPFVQADTSTTRKYGGSGLGLTISQTLARLLGGDLACRSAPGQGSVFRFAIEPGPLDGVRRLEQFPDSSAPRAALPALGPTPALRGRVLLAEDVAVNRRLISTILLRTGIRVEEAENGRLAMEKTLAARDAGQAFDIVFMDMQMPEMDGYEATRRLRQAGYLRPIVALTSHSMSGERQNCLDAGCDEYMTKPVDRLVLLQVLSRFLPGGELEQHVSV